MDIGENVRENKGLDLKHLLGTISHVCNKGILTAPFAAFHSLYPPLANAT